MTHPVDIIASAIRVADGDHTMGAGKLAEVALATTYSQILPLRPGNTTTEYLKGWSEAVEAVLDKLGYVEE
jgi:hypothetical protein